MTENTITLRLSEPGSYHLGIRYTPYLVSPESCVTESKDGMTLLTVPHAGTMKIAFSVSDLRRARGPHGQPHDLREATLDAGYVIERRLR